MLYGWAQLTVTFRDTSPLCQCSRIISGSIAVETKHSAGIINAHTMPERKLFCRRLNHILICLDELYKMKQRNSHQAIRVLVIKSQSTASSWFSRVVANK